MQHVVIWNILKFQTSFAFLCQLFYLFIWLNKGKIMSKYIKLKTLTYFWKRERKRERANYYIKTNNRFILSPENVYMKIYWHI